MQEERRTHNERETDRKCPLDYMDCPPLTEKQLEDIATRAAEVALERVYTQIGKSVVQKVLWWIGAATLAAYTYFKGSGKI